MEFTWPSAKGMKGLGWEVSPPLTQAHCPTCNIHFRMLPYLDQGWGRMNVLHPWRVQAMQEGLHFAVPPRHHGGHVDPTFLEPLSRPVLRVRARQWPGMRVQRGGELRLRPISVGRQRRGRLGSEAGRLCMYPLSWT